MTRKVVGITCGTTGRGEGATRQALNTPYVEAVLEAGGLPLIIPNILDESTAADYLAALDGVLFSGGVDVAPGEFGEEPHPELGEVDEARDKTELALARAALAADTPIFGICRGIQLLNVAMGGTLYQHLPAQLEHVIPHQQSEQKIPRSSFSHEVCVEPGTRLHGIVGRKRILTNSFHHQALKVVAPGLVVTARAPDGVIEAAEAPDRRYLVAVQFHPEETAVNDEASRRLFRAFIEAL